jgi:hypothetical protein
MVFRNGIVRGYVTAAHVEGKVERTLAAVCHWQRELRQ